MLHHVTVDLLRESFYALKRQASPGVDGMTWAQYEVDLEENRKSRMFPLASLVYSQDQANRCLK